MDARSVLNINVVKKYYNQIFTNELLNSMQKEIKIEHLVFSYNHYSNILSNSINIDKIQMNENFLKSDDEVIKLNCEMVKQNRSYIKDDLNSVQQNFNFFDPNVSEHEFEENLEKTFEYLNMLLESFGDEIQTNDTSDSAKTGIGFILENLHFIENNEEDCFNLFHLKLEKEEVYKITLTMITYIIRGVLTLKVGRKLIFSNEIITSILLKALYIQNIYVQIFTLRNLKKYIMDDKEECADILLKMIKLCLFSKSLCAYNRASEILMYLFKENKHINDVFDYYFLKKMKKCLETHDNIQRLRILDFIADSLNIKDEKIFKIFQIEKRKRKIDDSVNQAALLENSYYPAIYEPNDQTDFVGSDSENYTIDDITYLDRDQLEIMMEKHHLDIKQVVTKTKINVYKYLHVIYLKDDLLLKINVLEIFSKLVKNVSYENTLKANIKFLTEVLRDLGDPIQEILHMSILNSLISYSHMNSVIVKFLITADSNILLRKIIEYVNERNSDVERLIVGLKAFGYFFSIKEAAKIFLELDEDIHVSCIDQISTHSHTDVLRHSINIWILIIASKSVPEEWLEKIIHTKLFERIIIILKEIDDSLIRINIFELLKIMLNYSICNLILSEEWLINSLAGSFENNNFQLKKSRYTFFQAFYEAYESDIQQSSTYAYNVIKNYLKKTPTMYG